MQSSSQGRYQGYQGYQGYPYVNPIVTDVPTIDAETAARWANLPRRQVQPGPSKGSSGAGSSQTTQRTPVPPKEDIDVNPVVYIDIPEAGSVVSQSIETPGSDEPEFVQDTIMYDPFENRRIDIQRKDDERAVGSTASGSTGYAPKPNNRPAPVRPGTLDLASPGGSGPTSSSSSSRPTPSLPGFMSKESQLYAGDGADGFPISPIPISEFPEPPPAYTELPATPAPTVSEPITEPPPPRTQVIVPDPASPVTAIGVQQFERKNLICHHCGMRVHTVVNREVGCWTHVIAFFMLFMCFPLIIAVYMVDYFKYKNHYCPNCNELIGYETPIVGQKVNYVT